MIKRFVPEGRAGGNTAEKVASTRPRSRSRRIWLCRNPERPGKRNAKTPFGGKFFTSLRKRPWSLVCSGISRLSGSCRTRGARGIPLPWSSSNWPVISGLPARLRCTCISTRVAAWIWTVIDCLESSIHPRSCADFDGCAQTIPLPQRQQMDRSIGKDRSTGKDRNIARRIGDKKGRILGIMTHKQVGSSVERVVEAFAATGFVNDFHWRVASDG